MTTRAVIFDVYGTLLEVAAARTDADIRWGDLWELVFGSPPQYDLDTFGQRAREVIARHHAEARLRGIPCPEVLWPAVVAEVIPDLRELPSAAQADFIFRQMQISRVIRLADGAAECLRLLRKERVFLGIASNAQAYTLRELGECLQEAELDLCLFDSSLCFWSFEHGFSKPDPHVFRVLSTRLAARGIGPAEILMIGDRHDNDILPALTQGWRAWQLRILPEPGVTGGDFASFRRTFFAD